MSRISLKFGWGGGEFAILFWKKYVANLSDYSTDKSNQSISFSVRKGVWGGKGFKNIEKTSQTQRLLNDGCKEEISVSGCLCVCRSDQNSWTPRPIYLKFGFGNSVWTTRRCLAWVCRASLELSKVYTFKLQRYKD